MTVPWEALCELLRLFSRRGRSSFNLRGVDKAIARGKSVPTKQPEVSPVRKKKLGEPQMTKLNLLILVSDYWFELHLEC